MKSFITSTSHSLGLCALGFAAVASPLQAGNLTLDTTPYWDQMTSVGPFGADFNTATYGQTFRAPANVTGLQDFTFILQASPGTHLEFRPVVFAWTGSLLGNEGGTATGAPLYTGPSMSFDGDGTFQEVTANVGHVPLTPNSPYVIAFTVSDAADYAASTGVANWGLVLLGPDVFSNAHAPAAASGGGGFAFFNNLDQIADLGTVPWDNFWDYGDLAFRATFTTVDSVPDLGGASSLACLGLATVLLAAQRRSRR